MATTKVVWLRVVDDAREVRLRVGKRYAGQEVELRIGPNLQLRQRHIPTSKGDAFAFVTPEFTTLSFGSIVRLNQRGELIVYASIVGECCDSTLVIARDFLPVKIVSFRAAEDLQMELVQADDETGPLEVPRAGTSKPVRMRFLDDPLGENRTRPADKMPIVVQALLEACTFVNPKNGKRTDQFQATTDSRGCLPAFQLELKDGELRSEVIRLLVKPDGWDHGTITMIVPIELPMVEPEEMEEENGTEKTEGTNGTEDIEEPVAEELASLFESATARPFVLPAEPVRRPLPLGWMVAALVLLLGVSAAVFGELITRTGPLSNAVASNRPEVGTQPMEAAVTVAPELSPIILLAEKGDWHDVQSVCAQTNPRARCKQWSVSENVVEFSDCRNRFNENFGCACPGTQAEGVFTYTISRCRKTRVD